MNGEDRYQEYLKRRGQSAHSTFPRRTAFRVTVDDMLNGNQQNLFPEWHNTFTDDVSLGYISRTPVTDDPLILGFRGFQGEWYMYRAEKNLGRVRGFMCGDGILYQVTDPKAKNFVRIDRFAAEIKQHPCDDNKWMAQSDDPTCIHLRVFNHHLGSHGTGLDDNALLTLNVLTIFTTDGHVLGVDPAQNMLMYLPYTHQPLDIYRTATGKGWQPL